MLERLRANNQLVHNAELRLMQQRSFIERLQAAKQDTAPAEESLEIMRNLLGDLYQERTVLRRSTANANKRRGVAGNGAGPRREKSKPKPTP